VRGPDVWDKVDFVLSDRVDTRELLIEFQWWDGTPISNASVEVTADRSDGRQYESFHRYSDEAGRVRCSLMTDRAYQISFQNLLWKDDWERIHETLRVPAGRDPVRLKFVAPKSLDARTRKTPESGAKFNDVCP